jgi:hypothetical protein
MDNVTDDDDMTHASGWLVWRFVFENEHGMTRALGVQGRLCMLQQWAQATSLLCLLRRMQCR